MTHEMRDSNALLGIPSIVGSTGEHTAGPERTKHLPPAADIPSNLTSMESDLPPFDNDDDVPVANTVIKLPDLSEWRDM